MACAARETLPHTKPQRDFHPGLISTPPRALARRHIALGVYGMPY
ncbi:hypothetical protein [Nostoc sp. NIES-3756]|nr:hypothetical protein [Nostoc sp. NIES-3756]